MCISMLDMGGLGCYGPLHSKVPSCMAVLDRVTHPPIEGLLERLKPDFRSVLCRFRIPVADAEDLLQDTLLTFLVKKDQIHDPEAWILGTLRTRCRMYWRARRRQLWEAIDSALLDEVGEPRAPDQEQAALRHDLGSAISRLPTRCRNVLGLRYRMGCEPAETAERLGYSSTGIYKIIDRCLAALTDQLVGGGSAREAPSV